MKCWDISSDIVSDAYPSLLFPRRRYNSEDCWFEDLIPHNSKYSFHNALVVHDQMLIFCQSEKIYHNISDHD